MTLRPVFRYRLLAETVRRVGQAQHCPITADDGWDGVQQTGIVNPDRSAVALMVEHQFDLADRTTGERIGQKAVLGVNQITPDNKADLVRSRVANIGDD